MLPERYRIEVRNSLPELNHLRYVKPEKYHVTLRFLGEIEPTQIDGYFEEVDRYRSSFPVEVTQWTLSGFPKPNQARVVVLLLESNGKFESMQPSDSRVIPHLTVGYPRKRRLKITTEISTLGLCFESVGLYESRDGKYQELYVS